MLTKKTVEKVAQLSRLELTDEEMREFEGQFEKILEYFEKISEINTEGVKPLITPTEIEFVLREDKTQQEHSVEDLVNLAPDIQGRLYRVPPVV